MFARGTKDSVRVVIIIISFIIFIFDIKGLVKNALIFIGLNDKIAFIKHLFEGKSEDYERVMSQLNSFESFANAKEFLINIVKPDYNNWENKEEFEVRFLEIVENKFK